METPQLDAAGVVAILENLNGSDQEQHLAAWEELRQQLYACRPQSSRDRRRAWKKLHGEFMAYSGPGAARLQGLAPAADQPQTAWILGQGTIEAQVGALQIAGHLGGSHEEIWKDTVLAIAADETAPVDLRAWALYTFTWADLEVGKGEWDKIEGLLVDGGLGSREAKVRQWAAEALGDMARWGRPGTTCEGHSRLVDEKVRVQVEEALIRQARREIDTYVTRALIIALGYAGGHCCPQVVGEAWPVMAVLQKAAGVEGSHLLVRWQVPDAVTAIGRTIADLEGYRLPPRARGDAVRALMLVMGTWLEQEHLSYDLYRAAINTIAALIPLSFEGGNGSSAPGIPHDVSSTGLSILLDAAESRLVGGGYVPKEQPDNAAARLQAYAARALERGTKPATEDAGHGEEAAAGAEPDGAEPETLNTSVRSRAVRSIHYLVRDGSDLLRKLVAEVAAPRLEKMLADPSPAIAVQAIDALVATWGEKEAAGRFVHLILDDKPAAQAAAYRTAHWGGGGEAATLEELFRQRAAQALGRIKNNEEAYSLLVLNLKESEGVAHQRAYAALQAMGGRKAVEALVEASKREFVKQQYFARIDEYDELGADILKGTVSRSAVSFVMTLVTSIVVMVIGLLLAVASLRQVWQPENLETAQTVATAIGAIVAVIVGLLVPFFWNPASAVQKANAEMTKLVTSFHGYMGRMRLLGLGFAHAYSENEWEKPAKFLTMVSDAAGNAMLDSAGILGDISHWPGDRPTVQVPDLTGKKWEEAYKEARARGLAMTLKELAYHDDVAAEQIISHSPAAEAVAEAGATVEVTISKGRKPEGAVATPAVPDFAGMTWDEAQAKAGPVGLGLAYDKTEPSATVAKDRVTGQNPAAGKTVNAGDVVRLTFSSGPPPAGQTVPPLKGETWQRAEELAAAASLGVCLAGQVYDAIAAGSIVSQEPAPGTLAAEGSAVQVVVSMGPQPASLVRVPKLEGLSWEQAEALAAREGLEAYQKEWAHDAAARGFVVKQHLPEGLEVKTGSQVDLTMSLGPQPAAAGAAPQEVTVPPLAGRTDVEAQQALHAVGLVAVRDRERHDAQAARGTVLAQEPKANARARQGDTVKYTLSKGPLPAGKTEVPEFRTLAFAQAETLAQQRKLVLQRHDAHDPAAANTVVHQDWAEGDVVDEQATVEVVVSKGPRA